MRTIPSLFPVFDPETCKLHDGHVVATCSFCKKAVCSRPDCIKHYDALKGRKEDYYQCPSGFTSRSFYFGKQLWVITGVIGFPRFDTVNEREMAKRFPETKVARGDIDAIVGFFREVEKLRADAVQEAAKVFPQAFHELRKLNGAVLQHAEREMKDHGETRGLRSIKSAAELMRNNFDILEALSNIEGMRALPSDATINVYDLVYKTKCVLEERASSRKMQITLTGVRAIIRGSQKSFPIVPAVLLENAIKYGNPGTTIMAEVVVTGSKTILVIENETRFFIDPKRCFERGARFSTDVEGGGFGLFLAKEIVVSHKGSIACEASKGRVKMLVELPLEKVVA